MTDRTPRQPTEAMLNAARDWSDRKYGKPIGNDAAIGCWQAMFDAHTAEQPAPDAVAEAADIDAAYKDGWGFAYRQWQRTGSVPDPEHTLKGHQP